MDAPSRAHHEIAVPASIFATLRRELAKETGVLPTIHALHAAGYEAGLRSASLFRSSPDEDVSAIPQADFWARLGSFFARRGWGSLSHTPRHAGVGILASSDWAEGETQTADEEVSCSFSTGFLSGMLSELAGGPVAVLEVTCRSRGDASCSFAFGASPTVHELYGHLLEGSDLDGALGAL